MSPDRARMTPLRRRRFGPAPLAARVILLVAVFGVWFLDIGLGDDWHLRARIATLLVALAWTFWSRLSPLRAGLAKLVFESPGHWYSLALLFLGTISFAHLAHKLFQAVPHMDDSVAALYQARIFLRGSVMWPVEEAVKPFFQIFGVIDAGSSPGFLSGMYPPGWPALLVLGEWFKVPWLVNPILGGGLAVAVTGLGGELYGRRAGRLAGLLVVLSPFVGVLSATHLSHVSTALFCAIGWWAVLRLLATSRRRFGILAGFSLGLVLITRPESGILVGGIIGLGVLHKRRIMRPAWRGLLVAVLIGGMLGGTLLLFQKAITGDPLKPGHVVGMGSAAKLGFGQVGDWPTIHTKLEALEHSILRLEALNRHLLGWPVPSLLLVALPFILLGPARRDVWLLMPLVALVAFFSLYWYFEAYYPARYLFSAVPMLFVLSARGWQVLNDVCRTRGYLVSRLPQVLIVWGLVYSVTSGSAEYHAFFTPDHGDVESNLPRVIDSYEVRNAVVFMESIGEHPRGWDARNDYFATGFFRNNLDLDGDVVYARRPEEGLPAQERLIERYPGRDAYLYQYDRGTGRSRLYRYTVEDGRITAWAPIVPHDNLLLYGVPIDEAGQLGD